MMLAFTLSMPNRASWNGRWSGEDDVYAIIKTFRGNKQLAVAEKILDTGYYHYSFGDGWAAGISVKEVDSAEASKLRRRSKGFCGYDWMVDTIIRFGEPLNSQQVERRLSQSAV